MVKKTVMMRTIDALNHGYPKAKYLALVKKNGLDAARSMRVPIEIDEAPPAAERGRKKPTKEA